MIQFEFDELKATEVAAEFLQLAPGGTLDDVVLMKLMYFADRKSLELYDRPIIGDKLYCMENGPVLSQVLQLLNATHGKVWEHAPVCIESSVFVRHIKRWHGVVSLIEKPAIDRLTRAEKRIVNEVFEQYGSMEREDIVNTAHELCEYVETSAGSRKTLRYEEILKSLGRTADEIELAATKASSASFIKRQANRAKLTSASEQKRAQSECTS